MAGPWWGMPSNMLLRAESSCKNYFSPAISGGFSPIDTRDFAKDSALQIRETRRRSENHARFQKAKRFLL
jgi:hypothetical protein